jgi:replicative DNA helicase
MGEVHSLRPNDRLATVEAEQQLLGAILGDNNLFAAVGDMLLPEHFSDPVHADIYRACGSRITRGHVASPVILKSVMAGHEGLAALGGAAYLVRMLGASVSAGHIRDYALMILDAASRRGLIAACEEAVNGVSGGQDTTEASSGLLHALQRLPEASASSTMSLLRAATMAVEQAVEAYQGNRTYLKTGIKALDEVIKGLGPGDYMLLGGASSMGKTSVAIEIARNVAASGKGVAFVSREMSEEQLATRMASTVARLPYSGLRSAEELSENEMERWVKSFVEIQSLPIRIIPKHVRDMAAIHAAVIRARAEFGAETGLGLVIVDYAQLVRGAGKTRFEQMTDVSIGLKTLAGLLKVPVIALVQIDRNIGERDDKRPQMTDIRESGQFENDADQVVFCFREEYYLKRSGPKPSKDGQFSTEAIADWEAQMSAVRNVMELIVRKNRHGGVTTVKVGFHEATNKFWHLGEQPEMEF